MAKLTLSIADGVILRSKRYARKHGLSISQMVEAYLDAVVKPSRVVAQDAPILRSLTGVLEKANVDAHRRHLIAKYR